MTGLNVSGSGITVSGRGVDAGAVTTGPVVLEDFESGDLTEYNGDTGQFSVQTGTVYEGTYALNGSGNNRYSILNPNIDFSQGETIEFRNYRDDKDWRMGIHFGVQDPTQIPPNDSYTLMTGAPGFDLYKGANNSGTKLAETSITKEVGAWGRWEIDWRTNGDMVCTVEDSGGGQLAQITGNDTTWTTGNIGWFVYDGSGGNIQYYFDYLRKIA